MGCSCTGHVRVTDASLIIVIIGVAVNLILIVIGSFFKRRMEL
jgi:hypothetical protein